MQTPLFGAGFMPDAAFIGAAERFFELLKSFGMPVPGTPGAGGAAGGPEAAGGARMPPGSGGKGAAGAAGAANWASLAASLAGQFEQWLRGTQSAGPWFGAAGGAFPGVGGGFGAAGAGAFGPLPLGMRAAPQQDARRSWELAARLTQLQGQLAMHWSEIARSAAQRFVTRLSASAAGAPTLDNALRLYELWVSCAEESYAQIVHKDEFCRLQAELANVSAALLVEQRRHAETLVRAFGLPTRNEVDSLYAQLKELRRRLDELSPAAPPGADGPKRAAAAGAAARRGSRRKPRP